MPIGHVHTKFFTTYKKKEKNITKQDWDFKGLQDFYETFDIKLDLSVTKINNICFISKINIEKIFNKILNKINS